MLCGYNVTMITVPVVRVGNSRGVRIPKKMLEAIGSPDAVDLELKDGTLVMRPIAHPRGDWDNAARWRHAELMQEDLEWLGADLTEEEGN
jgi:antitoxin MazE